jgi:hypothetical protein
MAAVCPVAASLSSPPLGRPTLTTQRRRGLNVYILDMQHKISQAVTPQGLHTYDAYVMEQTNAKMRSVYSFMMIEYKDILRRVANRVHDFLSNTEAQLMYGQINSDLFERNRQYVDARLRTIAPDVLHKFVIIYRRMGEGDPEARSHALESCRRILKSLADSLYPSRDEPPVDSRGKARILDDEHYINRLWQYVSDRVKGHSAGELLLARISEIGSRLDRIYTLTNKGVHAEVTEDELNQGVIQTYLLVGDILRLADQNSALVSEIHS